jgi:DNA-binding NarL/FixJ family response regulator
MSEALSFLIVEDDGGVRRMIARGLSAYGRVESVGTCAGARIALRARTYDALVVDVGLPDGSGLDLIDIARQRTPGVHVLALTGSTEHGVISRLHNQGARYLLKPCTNEHLVVLVEEARARRDARERRTNITLERWTADHELSPTETELLALGAMGVPREEFSERRGVRPDTVRKQIQLLLRKTGHDTFEAAVNSLLREALAEPT